MLFVLSYELPSQCIKVLILATTYISAKFSPWTSKHYLVLEVSIVVNGTREMTCLIVASLLLIAIVLVQETQCHTSMQGRHSLQTTCKINIKFCITQYQELVPALVSLLRVVLLIMTDSVKHQMVTVSVAQTVIFLVTAVLMSTVPQVNNMLSIMLFCYSF